MGVQEVRAQAEDVAGRFDALGPLQGPFHFARKKGYAGVGAYKESDSIEVCTNFVNRGLAGGDEGPGVLGRAGGESAAQGWSLPRLPTRTIRAVRHR
jgi:hypothetical protein